MSPAEGTPPRPPPLPESWMRVVGQEFEAPYMEELRTFLREEKRQAEVYPPNADLFSAFWHTPFPAVRVVVLGQDPYHGPGQAHGLSFSVRRGVRVPPSLQNIHKELEADLGFPPPDHGELTAWAERGVLLLNNCLTVRARTPNSHKGRGWERFTDRVVERLAAEREGLAFVLWGAAAAQKGSAVDLSRHFVLRSAHPSPYSAANGFFGSRPFSRVHDWFQQRDEPPVDWRLG